jgi:N-methylhydantoinase B
MWRAVTLKARRGSIVDAEWPAGVSMGNTACGHNIRTCMNVCIAMMLDASEQHAHRAMASCMGSYAGQNVSGFWENGRRFGMMMMDPMAGGGGARGGADGVDTSGQINGPTTAIGNVEVNEYNVPMLYLWRRQTPDSGGPGRYRGGVGAEHAYVPHHVQNELACTVFGHGIEQPTSAGVAGGEPGGPNGYLVVRNGRRLAARSVDELDGDVDLLPPKATTTLAPSDVFVHWYAGGGGFGDPLDRDPHAVLHDVCAGVVTQDGAVRDFGVVVVGSEAMGYSLDESRTAAARETAREERLHGNRPAPREQSGLLDLDRLSSNLGVRLDDDCGDVVVCLHCGNDLGRGREQPLSGLYETAVPVGERWPVISGSGAERFVLSRLCCPHCGTQVHTEIRRTGGT